MVHSPSPFFTLLWTVWPSFAEWNEEHINTSLVPFHWMKRSWCRSCLHTICSQSPITFHPPGDVALGYSTLFLKLRWILTNTPQTPLHPSPPRRLPIIAPSSVPPWSGLHTNRCFHWTLCSIIRAETPGPRTPPELDRCTKRQLQGLLGCLNYAIRIIPQGKSFMSDILLKAATIPSLHDRVTLDKHAMKMCFRQQHLS